MKYKTLSAVILSTTMMTQGTIAGLQKNTVYDRESQTTEYKVVDSNIDYVDNNQYNKIDFSEHFLENICENTPEYCKSQDDLYNPQENLYNIVAGERYQKARKKVTNFCKDNPQMCKDGKKLKNKAKKKYKKAKRWFKKKVRNW